MLPELSPQELNKQANELLFRPPQEMFPTTVLDEFASIAQTIDFSPVRALTAEIIDPKGIELKHQSMLAVGSMRSLGVRLADHPIGQHFRIFADIVTRGYSDEQRDALVDTGLGPKFINTPSGLLEVQGVAAPLQISVTEEAGITIQPFILVQPALPETGIQWVVDESTKAANISRLVMKYEPLRAVPWMASDNMRKTAVLLQTAFGQAVAFDETLLEQVAQYADLLHKHTLAHFKASATAPIAVLSDWATATFPVAAAYSITHPAAQEL